MIQQQQQKTSQWVLTSVQFNLVGNQSGDIFDLFYSDIVFSNFTRSVANQSGDNWVKFILLECY